MVLTLCIDFLPFSGINNWFRYSKTLGSKSSGNLFGCLSFERLKFKRLLEKGIMHLENVPLFIWLFLVNELPTRYTRHIYYTHKHPRTPYAPMSALCDLHILDSFVILVAYFAGFCQNIKTVKHSFSLWVSLNPLITNLKYSVPQISKRIPILRYIKAKLLWSC